jgi:hypothetical protein
MAQAAEVDPGLPAIAVMHRYTDNTFDHQGCREVRTTRPDLTSLRYIYLPFRSALYRPCLSNCPRLGVQTPQSHQSESGSQTTCHRAMHLRQATCQHENFTLSLFESRLSLTDHVGLLFQICTPSRQTSPGWGVTTRFSYYTAYIDSGRHTKGNFLGLDRCAISVRINHQRSRAQ